MPKGKKLTGKQTAFIQAYLVNGFNATQAAITAGYSKKTANIVGPQNLVKPSIAKAIEKANIKLETKHENLKDQVIAELKKLAFSNMGDFAEWGGGSINLTYSDKLTEDQKACVSELGQTMTKDGGSVRFKLHSKTDALEKLCKHLGIYAPEKHDHTHKLKAMTNDEKRQRLIELRAEVG